MLQKPKQWRRLLPVPPPLALAALSRAAAKKGEGPLPSAAEPRRFVFSTHENLSQAGGLHANARRPATSASTDEPTLSLAEDGPGAAITQGFEPASSLTRTRPVVNAEGEFCEGSYD